jgi:hypothetical protein
MSAARRTESRCHDRRTCNICRSYRNVRGFSANTLRHTNRVLHTVLLGSDYLLDVDEGQLFRRLRDDE